MEGLVSLLIFAGLFYFMMRLGCGSQMAHGHHKHKEIKQAEPIFDPVCGMKIANDEGYGKLHKGVCYRFCSKKCLDEFDQQPEKYAANTNNIKQLNGRDRHDT